MTTLHSSVENPTAPTAAGSRERRGNGVAQHLWDGSEDVYSAILAHPFLRELSDGTLPRETFRHYLVQDGLYLQDYSRALRVLAARAPDTTTAAMFGRHAEGAVAAETALQADMLAELAANGTAGAAGRTEAGPEPSPTTRAYTSYLLATVRGGSFAEGLAAVLPCYWIYWEVGRTLLPGSSSDPLYARWIETYGGAGFGEVTREVLAVVDALEPEVGPREVALMHEHYRTASRYEWMFWDAAHRHEGWPL